MGIMEGLMSVIEEIRRLKEEKNAVILAHYYVPDEVQEIADYIGDSYYLSTVSYTHLFWIRFPLNI